MKTKQEQDSAERLAFNWGMDFVREVYDSDFGNFRRFLLRLVLGRKGFREFIGLANCVHNDCGYDIRFGGLGECNYYKDKVTYNTPFEAVEK